MVNCEDARDKPRSRSVTIFNLQKLGRCNPSSLSPAMPPDHRQPMLSLPKSALASRASWPMTALSSGISSQDRQRHHICRWRLPCCQQELESPRPPRVCAHCPIYATNGEPWFYDNDVQKQHGEPKPTPPNASRLCPLIHDRFKIHHRIQLRPPSFRLPSSLTMVCLRVEEDSSKTLPLAHDVCEPTPTAANTRTSRQQNRLCRLSSTTAHYAASGHADRE